MIRRLRPARIAAFVALLAAALAVGWRARQRWSKEVFDGGIGGDALAYYAISLSLERHHTVSIDGQTPVWTRLPGYPLFLALTLHDAGRPHDPNPARAMADYIAELRDWNFALDLACGAAAALIALALGARRWALLAALVFALQPWTALVAMHPLADPLAALFSSLAFAALVYYVQTRALRWLALAAAGAACAQWVKLDSLALLPPLALAPLLVESGWRRRAGRAALALALWAALFSPWPIRNQVRFGEFHVWNSGIDNQGRPHDRSAEHRWMRTFDLDEKSLRELAWAIPGQRVSLANLPPSATDSPEERAELGAIFARYNGNGFQLDEGLRARLGDLAHRRERRHPFDCWVRLPLLRLGRLLFGPHDGFSMGTVKLLDEESLLFRLLGYAIVGCALATLLLLARRRRRALAATLALALASRLGMLLTLPCPEPRYLLPIWPLLMALAAALPAAATAGTPEPGATSPATAHPPSTPPPPPAPPVA
jgi:hypothetical protein